MHLYFLRHGKAEEYTVSKSDRERRLTQRGVEDAAALAAKLQALNVSFTAIYTSPYPRAAETAAIVAEGLGLSARLKATEELASGHFGMGDLQTLTAGHGANASLLFVGHEPDLSEVVERLTGGVCEMKTACLAYVEADRAEPGRGVLQWLLPPKLLAALA